MIVSKLFQWSTHLTAVALAVLVSVKTVAHEGHDQPGAMPSAPHGGKLKEASGGTNRGSESELFFEAVFEDSSLKLYPLTLTDGSAFKALSPKKDLSNLSVEIEFPRAGKRAKLPVTSGADVLEATVNTRGAKRFLVLVSATHKGETKKTKLQVEMK